jgi:hypothetical protein
MNGSYISTGATFEVGLANECRCMQLVLVLTVHWWPTPVSVGGLLDAQGLLDRLMTDFCSELCSRFEAP